MAYKLQQNVKREKCARIAPLFSSPLSPFSSLSLSLFSSFLCCVSDTTSLFYQINISQNKSQDNFKLATGRKGREEKRAGVEREGEFGSVCTLSCEVESLSSRSPHFEVCGFVSSPSWSQLHLTDQVVTTAYECQMREHSKHPCL